MIKSICYFIDPGGVSTGRWDKRQVDVAVDGLVQVLILNT